MVRQTRRKVVTRPATHVVTYDLHWVGVKEDTGDYGKVDAIMESLDGRSARTETTWTFNKPSVKQRALYDDIVSGLRADTSIVANAIDIVVVRAKGIVVINDRTKI